jgi:hypothetical protein
MNAFNKLCLPAKIYLAIAVFAIIIGLFNGLTIMMVVSKLLFALLWTFLLGWLCKKGLSEVSWLLVLLPYIIILLAMLNIYQVTQEQRQFMRMIKLQGAYGQEAFNTGNKKSNISQAVTNPEVRSSVDRTYEQTVNSFNYYPDDNGSPSFMLQSIGGGGGAEGMYSPGWKQRGTTTVGTRDVLQMSVSTEPLAKMPQSISNTHESDSGLLVGRGYSFTSKKNN